MGDHPKADVSVIVGTSEIASNAFCKEGAEMVNRSYGYQRVSSGEIHQRLSMGDAGEAANRVLHVAYREGVLVGCCSSTIQTPWCPAGCGHWGLLVAAVEAQGTGVASALVAAAERRLVSKGLQNVQIEYEYTPGEPQSERLYRWYEGSCGFSGGSPPHGRSTQFRRCRKRLVPSTQPREERTAGSVARRAEDAPAECEAVHTPTSSPSKCLALLLRLRRLLFRRIMGGIR